MIKHRGSVVPTHCKRKGQKRNGGIVHHRQQAEAFHRSLDLPTQLQKQPPFCTSGGRGGLGIGLVIS